MYNTVLSAKEEPVEVIKCILNSDVIFKAIAKFIEAIQTKQVMTVMTNIMSLYPSVMDECKKCLGQE